jgi:transposase
VDVDSELFIGLDTSKLKISVAVADGGRNGEVRFYGDISSDPGSVASMVEKLAKRASRLHFCYEAGPTGYELTDADQMAPIVAQLAADLKVIRSPA